MAGTDETSATTGEAPRPDRRRFLRVAGAAAATIPFAGVLAACGKSSGAAAGTVRPVRIGYVSPQTGALAPFGDADAFVVGALRDTVFQHAIQIAGATRPVEIIVRDSESDVTKAGDAATDLILQERIDLMLVASTPETVNPVSDQCESYGVPCISTVAPWQSWYLGRRPAAAAATAKDHPFAWTYHFFWGLDDLTKVYSQIWSQVETNRKIGALFPQDPDGAAFSDADHGFPAAAKADNYQLLSPIGFSDLNAEYAAQITQFRQGPADIIIGVPQPPDFNSFWAELQKGSYRPKVVTVAKALLFPQTVADLGPSGAGLCSEVWWSPNHPFTSSLTGTHARELATQYEEQVGQQWTQPIGFVHALFEVAVMALQRISSLDDKAGLASAIGNLKFDSVVGPLDFTSGPNKNVATTPLVGGQWRQSNKTKSGFDLVIVSNAEHADIPLGPGGHVQPIGGTA